MRGPAASDRLCGSFTDSGARVTRPADNPLPTETRREPRLLELDAITLAFGGVRALSGVGFDVAAGSITSVIGPNGAGKTSLFNTISGFYRPTAGAIRFQGQDITRVPAPKRAGLGLARSFQNIALFRGMTVLDNIKLGRHCHMRTNVFDALVYFGRARRERGRCSVGFGRDREPCDRRDRKLRGMTDHVLALFRLGAPTAALPAGSA